MWYKLWGRLLEAERPAHQSNEQQTQRLWAKIRRRPRYYPGMKSDDAEAKVKSLTHEANMDRLRLWRARLRRDDKELFRWLREKPAPHTHQVFDEAISEGPQVLQKFAEFWGRIWDRVPGPTEMNPDLYLQNFAGVFPFRTRVLSKPLASRKERVEVLMGGQALN